MVETLISSTATKRTSLGAEHRPCRSPLSTVPESAENQLHLERRIASHLFGNLGDVKSAFPAYIHPTDHTYFGNEKRSLIIRSGRKTLWCSASRQRATSSAIDSVDRPHDAEANVPTPDEFCKKPRNHTVANIRIEEKKNAGRPRFLNRYGQSGTSVRRNRTKTQRKVQQRYHEAR